MRNNFFFILLLLPTCPAPAPARNPVLKKKKKEKKKKTMEIKTIPSALSRMEGDREREKGIETQGAWPGMCLTHRQCLEYSYFSTVHIFNSTTKYAHFCRLCLCPIMPLKDEAIPAQPCPTVIIHVVLVPVSHTQYLPMTRRTLLSTVDCRLSRQDKWKLFRSEGLCFLAFFLLLPLIRGDAQTPSTEA